MGVVDETRQIVQDFLAPELRAVAVRLEALEKTVEANECRAEKRYQALEAQMDKRFQTAEAQMDKRFQITESHFEKRFQSLQGQMEKSESRSVARHGRSDVRYFKDCRLSRGSGATWQARRKTRAARALGG